MNRKYIFWQTGPGCLIGIFIIIIAIFLPFIVFIFITQSFLVYFISFLLILLLFSLNFHLEKNIVKNKNIKTFGLVSKLLLVTIPLLSIAMVIFLIMLNGLICTKTNKLKAQVNNFSSAIEYYYSLKKSYPNLLDDLVKKKILKEIPIDPWGNEYYYLTSNTHYIIMSQGEDGVFSKEDDFFRIFKKNN